MKKISSKCLPSRAMHCLVATWSSVLPKSATAHQRVTHWLWRGRSWCCRGFASAQYRKFCLFTKPDKWKWASSLQSRRPGGTFANILSHAAFLSCQSRSWRSWTIAILYGWNFMSRRKILRSLRSHTPKASACLAAERCGDVVTACLTVVMFSCNRIVNSVGQTCPYIRGDFPGGVRQGRGASSS